MENKIRRCTTCGKHYNAGTWDGNLSGHECPYCFKNSGVGEDPTIRRKYESEKSQKLFLVQSVLSLAGRINEMGKVDGPVVAGLMFDAVEDTLHQIGKTPSSNASADLRRKDTP